jgi:hypothetical protein
LTTPGSGNRWEPPAGSTPEETAPLHVDPDREEPRDVAADEPRDRPPDDPAVPAAPSTGRRRSPRWAARSSRPRLWLVGVAAAFLLLGGVAGFFIGHATVGNGTEVGRFGQADQRGPRPGFAHDGFGHDDDGGPR